LKIQKEKKEQILADKDRLPIHQLTKKYNLSRVEIENIIKTYNRKTPKWFYAVLVLIPIIFLLMLEIILRVINYGYDFTQWIDAGEGKYTINMNIGRKYFTNGDFNPTTSEDCFDIQKKTNSFRVFVLGESSAEGFPYSPMGSFSRYIRRRLELVYPNTEIEVVNIGMTGVNSYALLDLLPGILDQKPDLILIYTGHNEYYGALGIGSVQSFGSSRILIKLMLYLNNFRITQLVRSSIIWISSLFTSNNNESSGTLMSRMAKDKCILFNSEVFNAGLQQFNENFSNILNMIREKGVPVIMGKLVCNLKDQKPFISVDIPGNKNADRVYEEARDELTKKNITKADSLFRLAKDLDALRFRAPEKINEIIDDLGKEFHVATVPIDSIFNFASPDGIVGDNLIVDHLHPNVKGYQLIGKAFYSYMERLGYLPKTENAKIQFGEQDSLTCANFVFTKLDSVIGNYGIALLKNNWPYQKESRLMSNFQQKDFIDLLHPKNFIDSIALYKTEGKLSWTGAHLLAAKTYLRRDDIKKYLEYINALLYQYPILKDYNSLITYFYYRNELDLSDYNAKRVGIIQLHREKFDDAIKYLREAYNSNPKDPLVLYNLSLAYSKKKDLKTAQTIINKCLNVNPNYPGANNLKRQISNLLKY
jgi:tetratricopeptide (TPR) repeat protein